MSQHEEFGRLGLDDALLGLTNNADSSSSTELQHAFVTQHAERPEDRVGVDAHDRRHVPCGGKSTARAYLTRDDVPANLGSDLLVQGNRAISLQLDSAHSDRHHITIVVMELLPNRQAPTVSDPPVPLQPEVVIKEARRRQRRRHGWVGLVGLLATALGLALAAGFGSFSGSGPRAGVPAGGAAAAQPRSDGNATSRTASSTYSAELFGATDGWAVDGIALQLTTDGGRTWHDATPLSPTFRIGDLAANVHQVEFVNRQDGWISAAVKAPGADQDAGQFGLARTTDGGESWDPIELPCATQCRGVHLNFLDADVGFALEGSAPSPQDAPFSGPGVVGTLYSTDDGGASWSAVGSTPFVGPIVFSDSDNGVGAANPEPSKTMLPTPIASSILYHSADGGRTWDQVRLPIPPRFAGATVIAGTPRFFGVERGVLPVLLGLPKGPDPLFVFTTDNGGLSWHAAFGTSAPRISRAYARTTSQIPFAAPTSSKWTILSGSTLWTTADGGMHWLKGASGLPRTSSVVDLSFASPTNGWAVLVLPKDVGTPLMTTHDGGRSWQFVRIPSDCHAYPDIPVCQNQPQRS